jgi:hypothetical protein
MRVIPQTLTYYQGLTPLSLLVMVQITAAAEGFEVTDRLGAAAEMVVVMGAEMLSLQHQRDEILTMARDANAREEQVGGSSLARGCFLRSCLLSFVLCFHCTCFCFQWPTYHLHVCLPVCLPACLPA